MKSWFSKIILDLLDVGVIVFKGDGTWDVWEMGDKFWAGCDEGVDEELLPFCDSMLESIKFFVFLFLREVDPIK